MKHQRSIIVVCSFLLWGGASLTTRAQVSGFGLQKTAYFVQTSDATPVLDTGNNHDFYTWIEDDGQSEIDGATVNPPGAGGGIDLLPDLDFYQGFTSQSAMDSVFGNGNYSFGVTTVDSDFFFAQLNVAVNNYPNIPQLLNFTALQSINTNNDLTLRWLPFQDGTANDYISVSIWGDDFFPVFESPGYGEVGALNGTSTSVVVPARILEPGPDFECYLTFNRISPDSSSGALGLKVFTRDTYLLLRTGGSAVTVTIAGYSVGGNGLFQVQVNGTPGATFTLEGTTGFNGWTTVDSITSPSGAGTLSDPATAANPHRFYRVKAG